jgi:hypothetical protein
MVSERVLLADNPGLITSLLLPGRTHKALVYIIEPEQPARDSGAGVAFCGSGAVGYLAGYRGERSTGYCRAL